MRTFDNYFEIFKVRHSDDKNFPRVLDSDTNTKESIDVLKKYFEEFWIEAKTNSSIEIEDLKNQNRELRDEITDLESRIGEFRDETSWIYD